MDEPKQLIPGLFRLRNRHGHCLRVDDMGVRGTKDENDEYTVLEFESVGKEGIAIRGKSAARHVGIDSDGNLSSYGSFIDDCVFIEQSTKRSSFTSFASRYSVGFYLGLRKDGRPKPGRKTAPGQKAVAFSKIVICGKMRTN